MKTRLVDKFDKNKDSRLDAAERAEARKYIVAHPDAQRRRQTEQALSRGARRSDAEPVQADPIRPGSVRQYKEAALYDPTVLRTLFLEFPQEDWFAELVDFYKTDVELPATLIVDGETIPGVGVRVRGTSSYLMVGHSKKKPFNISIDHTNAKRRLRGFRTLNLLNGNQDPSFLREVLFAHVAQRYIPTPRVNFVKLVINGENWGVYQNAQQFNRDFLKDWYGTRKGVRWKIMRNQRGVGALRYLGEDRAAYESAYTLRTTSDEGAWKRLIRFCRVLNETSKEELPTALPHLLDIDETLWFCALENTFLPNDGYVNQGYDYRLYEDPTGRFHLIPYDNNESLPPRGRTQVIQGRTILGLDASPLRHADDPERPIMHRLLAVPEWRARYLAHVRTIATQWLDWKVLGPICKSTHALIRDGLEKDGKRLFTLESFEKALNEDWETGRERRQSLAWIVDERRRQILDHPSMQGPWPELVEVRPSVVGETKLQLQVTARVAGTVKVSGVFLHFRTDPLAGTRAVTMRDDGKNGDGAAGDGVFGVRTPAGVAGTKISFYVEARANGVATFHPEAAEAGRLERTLGPR